MREDELVELEEMCAAATPGPWFVRALDDDMSMNLVAVTTTPDPTDRGTIAAASHAATIVAATLVQHPRYVDVGDTRWDENAVFIAAARDAVPRLIAEVRRLRAEQLTPRERPES